MDKLTFHLLIVTYGGDVTEVLVSDKLSSLVETRTEQMKYKYWELCCDGYDFPERQEGEDTLDWARRVHDVWEEATDMKDCPCFEIRSFNMWGFEDKIKPGWVFRVDPSLHW